MSEIDPRFLDRRNPSSALCNISYANGTVKDFAEKTSPSVVGSPTFGSANDPYFQTTNNTNYISIANNTNLLFDIQPNGPSGTKGNVAISYWMYVPTTVTVGQEYIWYCSSTPQWTIGYKLIVGTYDQTSGVVYRSAAPLYFVPKQNTVTISANTWYHYFATFYTDSINRTYTQLYINGTYNSAWYLVDSAAYNYRASNTTGGWIGRYMVTGGRISNVQIFKHRIISESEIRQLYTRGRF